MVVNDGFMNLDILLQKSLRCNHYKSYEESTGLHWTALNLTPKDLQVKKRPASEPVWKDFNIKWNNILRDAERNLVELLNNESSKVVERIELDLDLELKRVYPENYENKRLQLDQKDQKSREMLFGEMEQHKTERYFIGKNIGRL